MKKRIVSLVIAVIMLLSCAAVSQAAVVDGGATVQPMYNYTSTTTTNLNISSGVASCRSYIMGYNGTTTKIEITMTLQKKTLLWWSTVETWTTTVNSYYGSFNKSISVGGGTYRVKAVYKVYSGSNSETITDYSSESKV